MTNTPTAFSPQAETYEWAAQVGMGPWYGFHDRIYAEVWAERHADGRAWQVVAAPLAEGEVRRPEVIEAKTPCCADPICLSFPSFVHAGYPRRDERSAAAWNVRCDGCGNWLRAVAPVRHVRRNTGGLGWETLQRQAGALMWFDENHEVIR